MPRPRPAPRRARRLCLPLLPPRPPASLWPQLWCALALPFLLQTAAKPPNAAFRFPHTTASRARPSAEVTRVPWARPPGFYYPFLVLQDPSHRTPPDKAPRYPSAKSGAPQTHLHCHGDQRHKHCVSAPDSSGSATSQPRAPTAVPLLCGGMGHFNAHLWSW